MGVTVTPPFVSFFLHFLQMEDHFHFCNKRVCVLFLF